VTSHHSNGIDKGDSGVESLLLNCGGQTAFGCSKKVLSRREGVLDRGLKRNPENEPGEGPGEPMF